VFAEGGISSLRPLLDSAAAVPLGVLFALLLALALWLFVDLPLFLPDEG
jgi:hypothetical protein